jgi:hypothetical protein
VSSIFRSFRLEDTDVSHVSLNHLMCQKFSTVVILETTYVDPNTAIVSQAETGPDKNVATYMINGKDILCSCMSHEMISGSGEECTDGGLEDIS